MADSSGTGPRVGKVDHLGVAVKSLDEALKFYRDFLGLAVGGVEEVASQRVKLAFLTVGETRIELLEPTSPDGAVAKFIETRGEGLQHVALEVSDIVQTLDAAKAAGIRLVDETPRVGAGGHQVAFIHPKAASGVLIELVERPKERHK